MEAKPDPTEPLDELVSTAKRHLLANYRPPALVMSHGRGSELFDTEGNRYLDFCAGVAVCCLGHAHPALSAALSAQASRICHVSNYFYNYENVMLAGELCAATGFDRAFFCNSGTEAVEASLKLVRRWFHEQGEPRVRLIAFEKAFHGRTLGALALTGTPAYRVGFGDPLPGVDHVPYGDLKAVAGLMGSDVAAVVVEPLMGEGGVIPAPTGFLQGLRELCDAHGALLVFDEIQTGIGRTGKFLAADHTGVAADVMTLAKGLGGGVPIGALLLREQLADGLPPGAHGSTFGGNPLASVAARTVLRVLRDEGLVEAAARQGERLGRLLAGLAAKHPTICLGERGMGLLRAITLTERVAARDILPVAREHGLLLTAAGARALRFTPPLIVTDAEIDEAVDKTDRVLAAVASRG